MKNKYITSIEGLEKYSKFINSNILKQTLIWRKLKKSFQRNLPVDAVLTKTSLKFKEILQMI